MSMIRCIPIGIPVFYAGLALWWATKEYRENKMGENLIEGKEGLKPPKKKIEHFPANETKAFYTLASKESNQIKSEIKVDNGTFSDKKKIEKGKENFVTEQELQKESEEIVEPSTTKKMVGAAEDTTVNAPASKNQIQVIPQIKVDSTTLADKNKEREIKKEIVTEQDSQIPKKKIEHKPANDAKTSYTLASKESIQINSEIKVDNGTFSDKKKIEKGKEKVINEQELQKESEEIVGPSTTKRVVGAAEDSTVNAPASKNQIQVIPKIKVDSATLTDKNKGTEIKKEIVTEHDSQIPKKKIEHKPGNEAKAFYTQASKESIQIKSEIKFDNGTFSDKKKIEKEKEKVVTEQKLKKESEEIVGSSTTKKVVGAAEDTTVNGPASVKQIRVLPQIKVDSATQTDKNQGTEVKKDIVTEQDSQIESEEIVRPSTMKEAVVAVEDTLAAKKKYKNEKAEGVKRGTKNDMQSYIQKEGCNYFADTSIRNGGFNKGRASSVLNQGRQTSDFHSSTPYFNRDRGSNYRHDIKRKTEEEKRSFPTNNKLNKGVNSFGHRATKSRTTWDIVWFLVFLFLFLVIYLIEIYLRFLYLTYKVCYNRELKSQNVSADLITSQTNENNMKSHEYNKYIYM